MTAPDEPAARTALTPDEELLSAELPTVVGEYTDAERIERMRAELEMGFAALAGTQGVSVFGSARTPEDDPDYGIRPWDIPRVLVHGVGVATLVILLAVAVRLLASARPERGAFLMIFGSLAAMSAYAGTSLAIFMEPVIGANIGAGLMVLGAGPFAIGMLVVAGVGVARLRKAALLYGDTR